MSYMHKEHGSVDAKNASLNVRKKQNDIDGFVLEKAIFSNIFEKDIQRVYIYKKAERLAKAVSLIVPGLLHAPELAARADRLSLALVDAALRPQNEAKEFLSRELLALSSFIGMIKVRGLISQMNADLVAFEVKTLLDEIASYEAPHILFSEAPTLPALARRAASPAHHTSKDIEKSVPKEKTDVLDKGHIETKRHEIKDTEKKQGRVDAILAVLKEKGASDIKGISTIIRHVSEKTIQRELATLIDKGMVVRQGTRRWSEYSLAKK